jgi:predicted amidophosphoribosyltransferase
MKCRPRDEEQPPKTRPPTVTVAPQSDGGDSIFGNEKASALDSLFPVFPYRLWRQELLYLWKTRGVRLFSPVFGRILAQVIREDFSRLPPLGKGGGGPFVVVPIPPRPGKLLDKGWDQVADLCRCLEEGHHIPVARLLRRRTRTQQKKLTAETRRQNAAHAFCLRRGAKIPPRIILLDDLRTTGTTLEACADLLKAAGAQEVRALVLFGVD